jgi:hypothetical protein
MTTITLGKLIEMLNHELERHHHDSLGLNEDFRKLVVFKGTPNEHLNKDLPELPAVAEGGWSEFKRILYRIGVYKAMRKKNLPFNTPVQGDFLLFDFTEKIHLNAIVACESLEDLEHKITAWGGTLNRYSTCQIPIVQGKIRRFQLQCTHSKTGEHHIYHKKGLHDDHHHNFSEYSIVALEWLDE